MKKIPLSNSDKFVLVDDDKFDYLNQWRWQLVRGYAKRCRKLPKKKYTTITLSREVVSARPGQKVIYRDSDTLNCTKDNLIIGTQRNVTQHSRGKKNNRTKIKGVRKAGKKFSATIKINGKSNYIGTFETKEAAALAYDQRSIKEFGVFAKTNN